MSIKSKLLGAASAGLAAGVSMSAGSALAQDAKAGAAAPAPAADVKCWGINTCKGTAKCGVSSTDIAATTKKDAFDKKFAKSKTHDCAGNNICGASSGQLNWVTVSKEACAKDKGFLIKDAGGKKVVEKL